MFNNRKNKIQSWERSMDALKEIQKHLMVGKAAQNNFKYL